jgi:hypothetical protein
LPSGRAFVRVDDGVEGVGVRYGDVEQEVVSAGDDEDADGLGDAVGPVAERFDVLVGRWADADRDQRLHVAAQGGKVGLGVVAADHAALAKDADSLE